MTDKAAPRLLFIPAEPVNTTEFQQLASTLPTQLASTSSSTTLLKKTDPITIDLKNLTRGGNQLYMTLPARPGDVIMVPGSGDVLVDGWVTRPGAYKISPGMTVVGAVAAAGGSLFPANTSAVKLIRTQKTGQKTFVAVDLDKVTQGEQDDVPIQEGDIVQVSSSKVKLVPYGVFQLFSNVLRIGTNIPIQ
jgi:protein involved in polysaccharide export with SLBB domain